MRKVLNSNSLKIIAICMMLLDHVAIKFVPVSSIFYFIFRCFGRVCAPIMFYSLAKGYKFSKNKIKYGFRLFIFALISQIPYSLFISDKVFNFTNYNVLFDIFLAFLILVIFEKIDYRLIKYSLVCLCFILSYFCDWGMFGLILAMLFYFCKKEYKYLFYSIACLMYSLIKCLIYNNALLFMISLGLFLAIPFICLDNGKKGKYNLKYLFYIFYPLHMLILFII